MDCPDWLSATEWGRLEPVLRRWPADLVGEALDDLSAATATWDAARRGLLLEQFASHVEGGLVLPAAFILALTDLLGDPHE